MEVTAATYDLKFSRIKNFLLGKEKPSLYTQIACITGFISFAWFFSWYLLNLLALHMIETEEKLKGLKMVFYQLKDKYGLYDVFTTYYLMVLICLAASGIMFVGLLFSWRKKLWAPYLFIVSQTICIIIPVVFMGISYFINEMSPAEQFGPFLPLLLFIIEIWRNRRQITI
ncbi:MAG: hypothetical protein ACOZCO_16130 [Bacteroidota bacterium]